MKKVIDSQNIRCYKHSTLSIMMLTILFHLNNITMFAKIKSFLGVGKAEAAALIREIIRGHELQSVLFEPENKQALGAFVQYGHSFSPVHFPRFLQVADKALVKVYLEMGFELSKKNVQAVLDLKDDELNQVMMDSGSWRPFPFGSCMHHPTSKHHELEHHVENAEETENTAPAEVVPA
ncbi:MAG: hypothetical protein NC218_06940 [Acetobacter sp.]|nr:hypothetical protein [Acetobacter sp.]